MADNDSQNKTSDGGTTSQKEPQSYGSQSDWVKGETGQNVNRQKSNPGSVQADFYDERRQSETNAPHQGGDVSDEQLQDNASSAQVQAPLPDVPVTKVTDQKSGAKRGGFFKNRDYS